MWFLAWSLRNVLHKLRVVVVITQAVVVQVAVAVVTTATAVNASLVAQPVVMTVVVLVVVADLAAALRVATTVVLQPAVKAKAATQAVMTAVLLHAVTAKVLAASRALATLAVQVLLPVLTQAHRAVILRHANQVSPSPQVAAANRLWPTMPASVRPVPHADFCQRRFAQEVYLQRLAPQGASLFCCCEILRARCEMDGSTIIGLGGISCAAFFVFYIFGR